ncbi:MerR family transcriptional regulator [Polycladidibacter stylochi]|uniref:MerR family transcriptional regulator n=1 Tax=Polycladidibacter stylochi TaxID=1807766 RepID=UPI001AD94069|nr:MerR family transcriptional regulator [Pseudovibrio stylochi]
MTQETMKIGELTKKAGVSPRTVHYYESLGLITPLQRAGASHRLYETITLQRLEKIAALKKLGLSLEEIVDVIDLYFTEEGSQLAGKQRVIEILRKQLTKVDSQIDELSQFRSDLIKNIKHMERLYQEASERREKRPNSAL